jgi:hypothetical protein
VDDAEREAEREQAEIDAEEAATRRREAAWALGALREVREALRKGDPAAAVETLHAARGAAPGEPRPAFDQQPIEAGATADACARAFAATGERRWADACLRAAAWFLGRNDGGLALYDPETGGCHDGLGPDERNENQGAESTIALVSALQQARAVQAARSAASSSSVRTVAAPTCRSAAP